MCGSPREGDSACYQSVWVGGLCSFFRLRYIPPFSSPFPLSLCLSNSLLFVVVFFFFFFCFILCPFSHSLVVCAYLICSHHQHLSFSSLLFLLVRNKHTSDPTRPFFFSSCLVLMDWAFSADQNWYCGDFDEIWGWIYDLRLVGLNRN